MSGGRLRIRVEPELELELTRRNAAIALAAVVGVLLVASAAVAVAFDEPRVEGTESEFETVGQNESTVDTRIVLRNPNDVAVPGGVDLDYTIFLSDVAVARGTEEDVEVDPGRNTVETTSTSSSVPRATATSLRNTV